MAKVSIPAFHSEAEEARWWHRNRRRLDRDFGKAARAGRLRRLTKKKLATRMRKATRVISLRVAERDLSRAKRQAARKGLRYQTYIKSLLHEALRDAG